MSRMCLQFLRSRNSRIQPLDSTWIIPVPLLVLTALLLLFCGSAQSQTQNGNILGTVRDPSGAAVPGVKLTASQQETGTTRDTTSGPDGDYRFALLPFGDYTVTAEASGFKKFIKGNVHLATNQTLRVDVNLEVGEKTEEVTVTAEAAPITTDTGEISATQDPEFLKNHPGTHWNRAWMVASSTISATEGYGTFYGEPIDHTAATQDGIEYDQWNHLVYDYTVEEVKADVLNAPAKYQKSANINTVTRGGTNSFHGRAEIQIDNEIFWASFPRVHADQCTPLRACVGRWRAGMVVGGPLIIPHVYNGKNKTFWSWSWAPQKNNRASFSTFARVPNAALKAGDVSSLVANSSKTCGGQPCIINPATGQPFPNNIVPINSVTQKLLALYPQPDSPGGYQSTFSTQFVDNVWSNMAWRVDQNIGERNRFTYTEGYTPSKFTWDFGDRSVPGYMGLAVGLWKSGVRTFAYTRNFSPSTVNEFRFGYNYESPGGYTATGVDVSQRIQQLGLTQVPSPRVTLPVTGPNFTIPGFTPFLGWGTNTTNDHIWQFSDNLSIQRGTHTIQTGADYKRWDADTGASNPDAWPAYDFDGRFTGSGYADFLVGLPGSISRTNYRPTILHRARQLGLYLQDDWRVSPRLTLNLGVRSDFLTPQWDSSDAYYNYDPSTGNLVVPNENSLKLIDPAWPIGTHPIVLASAAHFPEKLVKWNWKIFPRVAFAFRPFNNDKTVVRGGYGIYVVTENPTYFSLVQTGGPYQLSTTFDNSWNPATNSAIVQFPLGFAAGTYRDPTPNVAGANRNLVYPYDQQWNLTLERALGPHGLRLSYIGSKDTNLIWSRNFNTPLPSTIPFDQSRRPNPLYRDISYVDNGANNSFNSFEAELKLKNFFGITSSIGYGWRKQLNDVSFNVFQGITNNPVNGSNPYCRRCDRGPGDLVASHALFATMVWKLPVGKGEKLLSGAPGPLNQIVRNWQITSIISWRKGTPFTPFFSGVDSSNTNTFSGRPDLVSGCDPTEVPGGRGPDHWFNEKCFAIPQNGRFGNLGRNSLTFAPFFMMNFGAAKSFPIKENYRIVFSMSSDNFTNHPNWGYHYYEPYTGYNFDPYNNTPFPGYIKNIDSADGYTAGRNYMRAIFFYLAFEF